MVDEVTIKQLRIRVTELERRLSVLVDRYNEHWHDASELHGYGVATYEPKEKFQVR